MEGLIDYSSTLKGVPLWYLLCWLMSMLRPVFKEFTRLAVQSSIFLFKALLYKRIEGLGMGPPMGPMFANMFMCAKEDSWLDKCPLSFKPALYDQVHRRYFYHIHEYHRLGKALPLR